MSTTSLNTGDNSKSIDSELESTSVVSPPVEHFKPDYNRVARALGIPITASILVFFTALNWVLFLHPATRIYYLFICLYSIMDPTPWQGGRPSMIARRLPNFHKDIHPMKLIRDGPPEAYQHPSRSYLLGLHPHGVCGIGWIAGMLTETLSWSKKFPGLKLRIATLNMNVRIPLFRELALGFGLIAADEDAIKYTLDLGAGNAVALMPGGSKEAFYTNPIRPDGTPEETQKLILNKRSGFFRLALQTGAILVPVYNFGESSLYQVAPPETISKPVRLLQAAFNKLTGAVMPLFRGRNGALMSVIPELVPLRVIVGTPLPPRPIIEKPTEQQIDDLREEYKAALVALFDKYKTDPKARLIFDSEGEVQPPAPFHLGSGNVKEFGTMEAIRAKL